MKQLKCKECGAPLEGHGNEYVCKYCGARYMIEGTARDYTCKVINAPQSIPLACSFTIERGMAACLDIPPEEIIKYKLADITRELALALVPLMTYDRREEGDKLRFTGRVRVIPPGVEYW